MSCLRPPMIGSCSLRNLWKGESPSWRAQSILLVNSGLSRKRGVRFKRLCRILHPGTLDAQCAVDPVDANSQNAALRYVHGRTTSAPRRQSLRGALRFHARLVRGERNFTGKRIALFCKPGNRHSLIVVAVIG